jgi:hypothetical protein
VPQSRADQRGRETAVTWLSRAHPLPACGEQLPRPVVWILRVACLGNDGMKFQDSTHSGRAGGFCDIKNPVVIIASQTELSLSKAGVLHRRVQVH